MKVSWPTKKETIRYSTLIFVVCVVVAIFFVVLDTGLQKGIAKILETRQPAITEEQGTTTEVPVTPTTNPVQVTPADVQATTPSGAAADVKVTPIPVK